MTFYDFAKGVVSRFFTPIYKLEVIGRENLPKEGGVLLCANHISNFDPVALGLASHRPIHFMAKQELFKVPLLGGIVRKLNAFPVKRGMSDREALRTGLKVLKEGHVLGLFPEGTRSKTGEIGKGLAGAGFFALRSNATVIPVAIIGPYKAFNKVKVVFGRPIAMDEWRKKKGATSDVTNVIMEEIKKLFEMYKEG